MTYLYRIGEFSKLCKLTIKALRYYDEVGLFKPAEVDEYTGYRFYTTAQLIALQQIVAFRQAGLSVEEISAILSGQEPGGILARRKEELRSELSEAMQRLGHLENILKQEDIFMKYQAVIRTLPKCTVFYKKGIIDAYADLSTFIPQAGAECAAANPGLKCAEPDYCFLTYVDHEFKERNVGLMYAQAVTNRGNETDSIKFKDLDAVEAVCVYHKGPYEGLGDAYAFAEQNGYKTVEDARECYIDGCWNKDDPADYLVELQFPVKKYNNRTPEATASGVLFSLSKKPH